MESDIIFWDHRTHKLSNQRKFSIAHQLAALKACDPVDLARKCIAQGDLKPVAVLGIDLVIPGIPVNLDGGIVEAKVIAGTTDFLQSREHGELVQVAGQFAEAYNRELWERTKPPSRK